MVRLPNPGGDNEAWDDLLNEFLSVDHNTDGTRRTNTADLLGWTLAGAVRMSAATRDANGAVTTATVVWPDGATGTFTTDTLSSAFPGAIDAYHVTHILNAVTVTVTQPAVTRDAAGGVITQPALTLS